MTPSYYCSRLNVIILITAASVLTFIHGHALEFIVEPSDTVVESGQSAVLDCVAKASRHQATVLIQWLDEDGAKLTFVGDLYRSQLTNGSLYITSVIEEQRLTGTYQCMATLPNVGSIVSRTAKLKVATLDGFAEEPSDLTIWAGERAHLSCLANGLPPPRMRWLKDERPLHIDRLRMTVLPSGALEIDEALPADQGTYRCNASGPSTYLLSRAAMLRVDPPDEEGAIRPAAPRFLARPRPAVYVEGQNASLDCAAVGNPRPMVTWLKDGYPIDMNDLDSRFSLVGTTSSLRITTIKEQDGGTYQCRAENREDSLDASALIQVQVPPRFLKKPQDKNEFPTKDVELECIVYGMPEPKIQWYKDGELVKYSEYYKLINGYNLKIMGLMSSDSGIFQCFATNEAGNIQASASLKVITADSPRRRPQSKAGGAKKARGGGTGGGGGLSRTAFTALRSSDAGAAEQAAFARSALSAVMSSTDVAGKYTCGIGVGGVRPKGAPSSPRDLRAPVVKGRFVTLSWKPPEDEAEGILGYSIYYRQEGSDRERYQNTTRSKHSEINIAGLQPGRVYHFRVVALGSNGLPGASSDTLTVTTQPEEHVAGAPATFTVYATSPRSIRAEWRTPEVTNGHIMHYTVYYMETTSSVEHNMDTTEHFADITGLMPYTEYSIWVVAVNENGAGAATEEKLVRTYSTTPSEPPSNITAEPMSTSVGVRWEPPPVDSQNGPILGYKIKVRKPGGSSSKGGSTTYTAKPNDKHFVIPDLERGVQYQVRIWAMNVNGTGPGSEWIDVETLKTDVIEDRVPDKPTNLRVRPTYDKLYIMWSPPENQSIRIRNYMLGWGKGVPDMFTTQLEEKERTFIIEKLDPNSEYVISLRASNQMGAGPPIYTTVRTQDEPPPEPQAALYPPMGLKAQVVGTTSVVLYWTDPTLKQSQFVRDNRYYVVQYVDEKTKKAKYQNATDLNALVDDLKPNTLYEFSVKTIKGRRESSWSMVVQNRTWELAPNLPPRDVSIHYKDRDSQFVELSWQPPKAGRVTGYVILYTNNRSLPEPEWNVSAVKGDVHSMIVYDLKPFTQYYFKVQARNSRGLGPYSTVVSFRTGHSVATHASVQGQQLDSSGMFSNSMLLYVTIAGCALVLFTVVGVGAFICCRKRNMAGALSSPERTKKGYQKGAQAVKPPDLWIHHDQMELKQMEKRHSACGAYDGASSSGALTLPRSVGGNDYDTHDNHMNSLDKRSYVSSHGAIVTPINPSTISQSSTDSTPSNRPSYPRTQYSMPKAHVSLDSNGSIQHQTPENLYSSQPVHTNFEANSIASQPPPVVHVPPGGQYAPAMGVIAESQGGKRLPNQGHPLKSFTVPAPPPLSAPGTPPAKHIVRPSLSPYKKLPMMSATSGVSGGGSSTPSSTPTSRINPSNPPPHTTEETQRLHPSHSTEELNQEMANLEGLMLTLNAITANEFEC
nr:unnamed protein product [Callosobruchus analis]